MTVNGRVLLAAAAALAMGLSGCSLLGDGPNTAVPPVPQAKRTAPTGSEALATFYGQKLDWKRCGAGQCAGLSVPMDYAKPDGAAITIQVLRMPATKQSQRIGSLVVDPGGPGASGIDYARAADFIVGKPVRQRFDIVGFDPRGVHRSRPVDCLSDAQMDTFLAQDPTPDTPTEVQSFMASMKDLGAECLARTGPLLAHISTEDSAKDMDILRSALGDAKLNYLGKSYGTQLGAVYAGLFPSLVGRFVLDGVLPPDLTWEETAVGQADGFERAAHAWARDCVAQGGCPLGDSESAVMTRVGGLLKQLDSSPVPMRDGRESMLTEGWASLGVAQAMYDQGSWGALTAALQQVLVNGDGTKLMLLADEYARRVPSGRYTDNLLEAFYAISCLDTPGTPDPKAYEDAVAKASVKAPVFGPALAWGAATCSQWPVKAGQGPHKISAAGSGPIVVIGTTRDPATPYEWAVREREQLANARLLTFDGDGHTAYTRSNSCIDNAVNDYYTSGKVPADKTSC
ncbi:pimeloyl-ACP methyl ester carboxylesterase [Phycicoccus badiiscoriae]|uniref:Pimeloyl-ACP methyl ester carboxylesterase n=1 Tax=Pedococcus badiiscoriae TaxID=642776 RepID=A0A852WIU9_9MICO|nr:alpha/beta hydrolase [Pedococcus badiiscoriae]NYG06574.1 pimeloyl-ACP methyl ester carboxylesterase [Pedococcus badiiscoriae]